MRTNSVEELIEDIREGKMIILMYDEDRENEGDLLMAASRVTPEAINFMASHARGLICLTLTPGACEKLALPLMVDSNASSHGTNFTLSIEAASGVTTGISAADRAHTIRTAVSPSVLPDDIVQPGHVFPLMAKPGGVLYRAGHTEAGCDLTRMAGLESAAVIVEIMNEDGTMARRPDLEIFAEKFDLKLGTIADLIQYRSLNEKTIELVRTEPLETECGEFMLYLFQDLVDKSTHVALVKGNIQQVEAPLVRVHVADPLRDLLEARVNDKTGWNVSKSLKRIADEGEGVLLLLGPSFESFNMLEKVDEFFSPKFKKEVSEGGQSNGYRTIGTGSQILKVLGVEKMRLLSSRIKFNALSGFQLEILEYLDTDD